MLNKRDLDNTYFVPMTHMRKMLDFLKNEKNLYLKKNQYCNNNLYLLQRTRQNTLRYSVFGKQNWVIMYSLACHKALYSHDWDKLLYLIRKMPKWKFYFSEKHLVFDSIYTRYLILLLMYHPSSQYQGLLSEYLHMALGCRTDNDKKALLKVLLDLPRRLASPIFRKQEDDSD